MRLSENSQTRETGDFAGSIREKITPLCLFNPETEAEIRRITTQRTGKLRDIRN